MPRGPRKKYSGAMYHVMSRSISEVNLFASDEDKQYYLSVLKKSCEKYHAGIFGYCLMDNHVHLFINPNGADISSIMRSVNNSYVPYYNRIHKRHGTLFQGRFASIIVDRNAYGLALSAYIHNNSKDIPGYHGREEEYPFSSYGIYLGLRKDTMGLVDTSFILSQFSHDLDRAREKYRSFVSIMKDTGIMVEVDENIIQNYTENVYRNEKKYIARDQDPDKLVDRVCELLGEDRPVSFHAKYRREKSSLRAFAAYVLHVLSGCTYKKICEQIGNLSLSGVARLTSLGYQLCMQHERYRQAFTTLI